MHIVNQDYNGHEITLNQLNRFSVSGPAMSDISDEGRDYSSYHDACEATNSAIKALEKQNRLSASVAITMLDNNGTPLVVKGIHSGTGALLGTDGRGYLYPDVSWIKAMLVEMRSIVERRDRLQRILKQVQVGSKRGYGRIDPDKYESMVAAFVAEVIKNKEIAEKNAEQVAEVLKP